ncbi:MAG: cation-translocating P-type ATPase [Deltaproteobacteria bacterium]|nr:cation-translocating P-type ATPase [Deltaproteobacteria bacterium]
MTVSEVLTAWESDADRGLSPETATERRQRLGLNKLPEAPRPSALKQLLAQFVNPLVGTLLAAAAIGVGVALYENPPGQRGIAKFSDVIAILIIVIVNAIIGFVQERKAERALDALQSMTAPRCRVIRSGVTMTIESEQLVPGDIVELSEGDQIPADLRLVVSSSLETVEGALTGESANVAKDARKVLSEKLSDADLVNMVFLGTNVARGSGRGVVVATGAATRLGRIGTLLQNTEKPKSPLEERLEDFGNKILYLCLAISAALFVTGLVQGGRWHLLLLTAVSVAVAAIPEGLPAITTITLALGMQRMAKRNALVRKLSAVETLGCVHIICSDKTGTLTMNQMTVRALYAAGVTYEVLGEGYDGFAKLMLDGEEVRDMPDAVRRTIEVGAIANTAVLEIADGGLRVAGDPTEAALLALGTKLGAPRESMIEAAKTALHVPFTSERARMTLVLQKGGRFIAHTKGAVERVLPLCTHLRGADGQLVAMTDTSRKEIETQAAQLAERALRVLALAERNGDEALIGDDELPEIERAERCERELVFVGLVGMKDPARPEAREAIRLCREAGIRAVMITGDHRETAVAIAKELDLWGDGDLAMTGLELDETSEQKLQEIAPRVRVFARVSPEHKLRIVRAFKNPPNNEVVAMTGDGVNDAPAIRESSIGISMGRNGTDVARQASDLVLADDNFATIVEAVREGRAIFSNIKKSIFFLLSSNAGLCIAVFVTSFFKDMPPLSPLQILWINLVTNGLPALALGVDPPEKGQMQKKPRPSSEAFLTAKDWWAILGIGTLMASSAMVVYVLPWWDHVSAAEAAHSKLTLVFTILALGPLVHAFSCRSESDSIFTLGWTSNRLLIGAVIVSASIHMLAIGIPSLQPVFRANHVWTMPEVLLIAGMSILPLPAVEIGKVFVRAFMKSRAKQAAKSH